MALTTEQLLAKVREVLKQYKSYVVFGTAEVALEEKNQKLFSSMKRWHSNSHISTDDWEFSFNRIKHGLDVKEKMRLPGDLQKFLRSKFSQSGLKTRFSVCNILAFLEPIISRLYKELLEKRDLTEDEFGLNKLPGQSMLPEELTFYEREFLPYALFLTYSQRHPNDDRESLMDDIFSTGSGSVTPDLTPEVTALCASCANNEGFPDLGRKDIEQFNIQILQQLIKHNFKVTYAEESSSSDESIEYNSFWFNPFSSDDCDSVDSGAEAEDITDSIKFKCSVCAKEFSKEDFLEFHEEWFHKTKIATSVNFVDEPEDLILTFHGDDNDEEAPAKRRKGERKKSKKNIKKEGAKKFLRFKK